MQQPKRSTDGQQSAKTHLTNKRSAIRSLTGGHVEGGRGRCPLDGLRHKGHSRGARKGKEERGGDGKLHLGGGGEGVTCRRAVQGGKGAVERSVSAARGPVFCLLIEADDVLNLVPSIGKKG